MRVRLIALAISLALVTAACSGSAGPAGSDGARSRTVDQAASSPRENGPSALDDPTAAGLPPMHIDRHQLLSGGPPPDGIPAIDEPRFLRGDDVDFLEDEEAVLVLEIDGESRAYPAQILIWHEIVNDTIGGVPVAVTYCPLCNSAVAFDRRLGERTLDFGTSGLLYRSALVMYDRQTESLWTHFTGEAVAGMLTGERLRTFPVSTVSWQDWRDAHPDGLVLSRDTGHDRDYGRNPYEAYDEAGSRPFLFEGDIDGQLPPKDRVIGILRGGAAVAVRLEQAARRRVVEVDVGGEELVVWWKPGTASALDAESVGGGRDVGATGVFVPRLEDRTLHFEAEGEHFRDRQTESRWDIFGRALEGPLAGRQLGAVEHLDTFWFAWSAYQPRTSVLGA